MDARDEADVLHRAEPGRRTAHRTSARRLEANDDRVVVEQLERPLDDLVAAVAVRRLQLDHDADAAAAQVEHLRERRVGGAPAAGPVVGDDELAVGPGVHVELDVVGAELDRALERRQRVLGQPAPRAAMGDDEGRSRVQEAPHDATSMPVDQLVGRREAVAARASSSIASSASRARARAEATPASVSSKATASAGADAEQLERPQVALGVRLAVRRPRPEETIARKRRREPGGLDDGLDLRERRAREDRDRHALPRRSGRPRVRARSTVEPSATSAR